MKRIYADEKFCIGCRLCEVHCLVQHSKSKHIIKAFREEQGTVQPRCMVEQMGVNTFALQCRHCEDAACLEACMTGAMHRDPVTGAVICDEDKCVGCWMCVMVCPLGAVLPSQKGAEHKVASKCDLCGMKWDSVPPCVANCPNEALKYEERELPEVAAPAGTDKAKK
jgi:anaerobic carbon-monoxide dehydrogenase iron sulfur subunit